MLSGVIALNASSPATAVTRMAVVAWIVDQVRVGALIPVFQAFIRRGSQRPQAYRTFNSRAWRGLRSAGVAADPTALDVDCVSYDFSGFLLHSC